MLEPGRLAEIAAACRRNGIWLVSDEIYHGLTYGMPEETALSHSDEAIVVNSFSKYFSMTGWRIGWLIVPDALVRPIERLAQNLYISPPTVAQVAALGAFDGMDELEANRQVYAANRRLLLEALPKAGLTRILPADGAFYLYVDIGGLSEDSLAFMPRRPASTSTPSAAAATCASATPAPRRTSRRRRGASAAGAGCVPVGRQRHSLGPDASGRLYSLEKRRCHQPLRAGPAGGSAACAGSGSRGGGSSRWRGASGSRMRGCGGSLSTLCQLAGGAGSGS
jgi:hypothetical protein